MKTPEQEPIIAFGCADCVQKGLLPTHDRSTRRRYKRAGHQIVVCSGREVSIDDHTMVGSAINVFVPETGEEALGIVSGSSEETLKCPLGLVEPYKEVTITWGSDSANLLKENGHWPEA